MTETLATGYQSESTRSELSNEHKHDRVSLFFLNMCVSVFCLSRPSIGTVKYARKHDANSPTTEKTFILNFLG